MAVFGVQLVLTMIMASVLSKVSPYYSFAKWLMCSTGLAYYMHPSNEELMQAAGISKKSKPSSGGNKGSKKKGEIHATDVESSEMIFNVPRNVDVQLSKTPVTPEEVMGLRFFSDYQWLLDFSLCSAIVYIFSEMYIYVLPTKGEINLSMLWCLLAIGFSLRVLYMLTKLYFSGDDSGGEKAMVVLSFFVYLLAALGILVINEDTLDLGLDSAYSSFNKSAAAFLLAQGLESQVPASNVTFRIILALFCALIGAFFTFPGLRLGKMHWDLLRCCGENRFKRNALHASFLAPVAVVLLWVRPLSRRYFTEIIFSGYSQPIMTSAMFDIVRLILVMVVGVIRIGMMPLYMQSYLNLASEKIDELKRETGKISSRQFQRTIARVFYYLCVVTLQYISPVIIFMFMSFMCKTLGGLQWRSLLNVDDLSEECGLNPEPVQDMQFSSLFKAETVSEASETLSLGFDEIKKIFTTTFYRGTLGFCTWWCLFSWFMSSTFGVFYQMYFSGR